MSISKEEILSIPTFKLTFEHDAFKAHLDTFLELVNEGAKVQPTEIIKSLLEQYIYSIGFSKGHRTIYFDFAWSVLESSPELWNDEETKSGFSMLNDHVTTYFPDYQESDNDDVSVMNTGEYLISGFDVLDEWIHDQKLKEVFAYAMYIFYKNGDYLEIEEVVEVLGDAD